MSPYPKLIVVLALTVMATACNAPASTPIATASRPPTVSAASQGATQAVPKAAIDPLQPSDAPAASGGEAGGEGGEAPLVTYADPRQGFSIDYPKPWTRDASVTAGVKFDGDGTLTLAFVEADPSNVRAYANADASSFAGSLPNFKQLSLSFSREVNHAVVLVFETIGTSNVTGKTYAARGDRYYIPLQDGRIAVLTVVSPVRNYDGEGVRDIALTLTLTK